jgi:hypothetical protein
MKSRQALLLSLILFLTGAGVTAVSAENPPVWDECRYLPAGARTIGYNDAYYATDVYLTNTGSQRSRVSITLLTRDSDASDEALVAEIEPLAAGASVLVEDAVAQVISNRWRSWRGGLIVCSQHPGVEVFSRIYHTDDSNTTYGQGLAGMTLDEAVQPGEVGHILALREDGQFRSNLGLMNPSQRTIEVFLTIYDQDGHFVNRLALDLGALAQVQFNRFLERFADDLESGRVEISSPRGPVFAYASLIDERTNDPTLILPIVR